MTLQQLRYIVAVAETGTITEAADKLFISQPSLTNAIRELEKEMKILIFHRTKKGIRLSKEGEDFLVIYPGIPQPSVVNTYEDHRMAMAFSLIGLRSEGIVIDNPLCCKKTFEEYFTLLDQIIKEHR